MGIKNLELRKSRLLLMAIAFCLISFLICVDVSYSEGIVQKVDPGSSVISFSFSSKIVATEGKLSDYDGSLVIDEETLKPKKIKLTTQPSAITFDKLPFEQSLLITGLVRSIPAQEVTFESQAIEPLGPNRFMIVGQSSVGRKVEKHSFPVNFSKLGKSLSILSGAIQHSGLFGNPKDPRALVFGQASGKANFELQFKR